MPNEGPLSGDDKGHLAPDVAFTFLIRHLPSAENSDPNLQNKHVDIWNIIRQGDRWLLL